MARIETHKLNEEDENLESIPDIPCSYADSPAAAKLWAKSMWLARLESAPKLAETIGVPNGTMYKWISSWNREITDVESKALAKVEKKYSKRVEVIFNKMLQVMDKSANHILNSNMVLTIDQFKGFTSAAETLFKMKQLEEGKPTEIYGGETLTWEKVLVRMKEVDIVEYDEGRVLVRPMTEAVPEACEAWVKKSL